MLTLLTPLCCCSTNMMDTAAHIICCGHTFLALVLSKMPSLSSVCLSVCMDCMVLLYVCMHHCTASTVPILYVHNVVYFACIHLPYTVFYLHIHAYVEYIWIYAYTLSESAWSLPPPHCINRSRNTSNSNSSHLHKLLVLSVSFYLKNNIIQLDARTKTSIYCSVLSFCMLIL